MIKNKLYNIIQFALVILFFSVSSQLSAQLNLNVGYNISYLENELTNNILKRYNENNPWLNKSFKEFHLMDGIIVGTRYRFGPAALLLQWTNKKRNLESNGTDPSTDETYFRDLKFQYNSYSAGLQFFMGPVSFGGLMDYSHYTIKTAHTDKEDFYKVLSNQEWSSHIFLNIPIYNGSKMGISLQPYAHVPWSNINIINLEQELNPEFSANADPVDYNVDFRNYGISLIFYNGQQ
jgi:hypothetical protein